VSGVAVVLLIALVLQGLREKRIGGVRRAALVAAAAFLVEMAVDVVMMTAGASPLLAVVYVTAATLLWSMVVNLAVLAGLSAAAQSVPSGSGAAAALGAR